MEFVQMTTTTETRDEAQAIALASLQWPSYDNPEIVVTLIVGGSDDYLGWIEAETER